MEDNRIKLNSSLDVKAGVNQADKSMDVSKSFNRG
jgi:hypothetical protein